MVNRLARILKRELAATDMDERFYTYEIGAFNDIEVLELKMEP